MTPEGPTPLALARDYHTRGWAPVPVPFQGKGPRLRGWQDLRVTHETLSKHFNGKSGNVGVITGEASHGLVDIDLDWGNAGYLAPRFLPGTLSRFGRAGKPGSHWLYYVDPLPAYEKFTDPTQSGDQATILEIRGDGHQTIFPGSVHPSGELIRWEEDGDPTLVTGVELRMRASALAAACILAAHWPTGARQDAALALTGGLLRAGWPDEKVRRFLEFVALAASDEETPQRLKAEEYTATRLASGLTATGWPTLVDLVGRPVVDRVTTWLVIERPVPVADSNADGVESPVRPVIRTDSRFLRDLVVDAVDVLQQINASDPVVFRFGSALVRRTAVATDPLTPPVIGGLLERSANFTKLTKGGSSPSRAPSDMIQDLLALPDPRLPRLTGIATAPVFLPAGELLNRNGYHEASGLYVVLDGLEGVAAGSQGFQGFQFLTQELLCDFPFADEASRANAVAMFVDYFARFLIEGPRPLYLIDAPGPGHGKGLLAELFGIVTTGAPPPVMSLPSDNDEVEKRITALLLTAPSVVLLDNVVAIKSDALAALLTTRRWQGRVLGRSQMITAPNDATWLATGNNVVLGNEMPRRIVRIRLDAGVERPERRGGFRHQLPRWAHEHRADLVSACLSPVKGWLDAGRPRGDATLGRFEGWAETVGGIVTEAGGTAFLSNRDAPYTAAADTETLEWQAFCGQWWERFNAVAATSGELLSLAREKNLLLYVWGGRRDLAAQQRVGHALSEHRDRVIGEFRIRDAGRDGRTGANTYRLEEHAPPR